MRVEALNHLPMHENVISPPAVSKLLGSTVLGTILEWYDFSIFAYLTPLISALFFPNENPYTAMMMTYGIFAAGFFVRPLGAAFFGHYGDRLGRKKVLVWSMVMISLATACIGCLPTYSAIGIFAPILLLLLRLVQGFCIGGEATGATSFILESYRHSHHRGFLGSLAWAAVGVGMLLGSLVATLITHFASEQALAAYVWRIPFLFGILAGGVGYYIRVTMPESLLFREAQASGKLSSSPLIESLTHHKGNILKITGLYALSAMTTYLIFIFMPNYVNKVIGLSFSQASLITTIGIACVTFIMPFAGWLSDRVGRLPCLKFAAYGYLVLSYPLFWLMTIKPAMGTFILVESFFVILAILYQGVLTATVQELSETRVRYSVSSIGYNLSYSVFGGTAPMVATYLVYKTGLLAAPGVYLALGGLAALITIYSIKETARQAL